jgi:signal recognition particle subunit SRP14
MHTVPYALNNPAANEKPRKSKTDHSGVECVCLVRATDGKRKLSTLLTAKELPRFQDSYGTILKVRAASLLNLQGVQAG